MADNVIDILEHHGIKGMRWGVRNDTFAGQNARQRRRTTLKLDKKFEQHAKKPSTFFGIYNDSVDEYNKTTLVQLNNKPKYKAAAARGDLLRDTPIRRQYEAEHQTAFLLHLNKAAKKVGTNASGTRDLSIVTDGKGNWGIRTFDKIEHAVDNVLFTVKVNRDSQGFITSIEIVNPIVHGKNPALDILEHFGTKGMRWGIRKSRKKTGVSRVAGVRLDRNARRAVRLQTNLDAKKVRLQSNLDLKVKTMQNQEARIRTGKETTLDTLKIIGGLPLSGLPGLLISRRPR